MQKSPLLSIPARSSLGVISVNCRQRAGLRPDIGTDVGTDKLKTLCPRCGLRGHKI